MAKKVSLLPINDVSIRQTNMNIVEVSVNSLGTTLNMQVLAKYEQQDAWTSIKTSVTTDYGVTVLNCWGSSDFDPYDPYHKASVFMYDLAYRLLDANTPKIEQPASATALIE